MNLLNKFNNAHFELTCLKTFDYFHFLIENYKDKGSQTYHFGEKVVKYPLKSPFYI